MQPWKPLEGRKTPVYLTVDAIVVRRHQLLLVKRGRPPFEGTWALPGGFVEADETIETAVLRELKEETGLDGKIKSFFKVMSVPNRDPRGRVVDCVFVVRVPPTQQPKGGDDAAEARFWPLDDLPPLAFDHPQVVGMFKGSR